MHIQSRIVCFLFAPLCFLITTSAAAQSGSDGASVPSTREPDASAGPSAAEQPAPAPAPTADENRFDVFEYRVEGNRALPAQAIEKAVYPFLGERRSVDDVEAARLALEEAYHKAGYLTVLVDLPEQEVGGGVVRLKVTEGEIERLRVVGSRYYSLGRIKSAAPELAEGNVPYFPEMQKQLVGLSRSADRKVTPVLRPGRTPGKVEVDLKVEDRLPLHGNLELNDRYTASTTRTRLSGSLRYDNLFQREHSLSLGFQLAPEEPKDSKVFTATYVVPLRSGDFLAAYGVISKSDVAPTGDISTIGNGNIVGLRYIRPLRPGKDYYHNLAFGADYKDFGETINLLGADSFNRPVSYAPFSLGYDGTLRAGDRSTNFNLAFNFLLRGLGNDSNEFANKRVGAETNYAFLRANMKHIEPLPAGWKLAGHLSAQLASGPLISNEQFSAGGVESVRGYLESNSLGDDGVTGGLELRTPSMAKRVSERMTDLTAYAFVEGGTARVRQALAGQVARFNLLGAGLGIQFAGWGGISGKLDWAYPFEDAGPVQAGDGRVHFRLGYEW